MKSKNNWFIAYSWFTVVAWYAVIWLLSSVQDIDVDGNYVHWFLSSIGYELAFGLQFILIFRAIIVTLKLKVEKLMYWKTKREKEEDQEFVKVIETLILFLSISITLILAISDEYHQTFVSGRISNMEDILVNLMGIIIAAIFVFVVPIIAEIEDRLEKLESKPNKHKKRSTK